MHDVLAHRISLVTMHAGALAYRTDLPPEQVRETAELIQAKAHEAMTDLRQVLGMLRGEDGVPDRPQPTLADLRHADGRGPRQRHDRRPDPTTCPPRQRPREQVGRTLYRIVQEALTNARKHAAGHARLGVRARRPGPRRAPSWCGNAKPVSRLDHAGRRPGPGLGLVGLRERAALTGGTLGHRRDRVRVHPERLAAVAT